MATPLGWIYSPHYLSLSLSLTSAFFIISKEKCFSCSSGSALFLVRVTLADTDKQYHAKEGNPNKVQASTCIKESEK